MNELDEILQIVSRVPELVEAAQIYKDTCDKTISTLATAIKQQPEAVIPDEETKKLENCIAQTKCALPDTEEMLREITEKSSEVLSPIIYTTVQQAVAPLVGIPPTPQGVKLMPNAPQARFADIYQKSRLFIDINDISGGVSQKAFLPGVTAVSASLFPNDKGIDPVLSSMTRMVIPDLAKDVDNQLSVGTALSLLNPMDFLMQKAMEGASFLKTAEFNESMGTNIPAFLAKPLGLDNIGRISGGLLPDMTIGVGCDMINDGELLSGQALLKLPVGLADVINDGRPKIEADFSFIRNTIHAVVSQMEFEIAASLLETKKAKNVRARAPLFSIYADGSFLPLEVEAEIKALDAIPKIANQLSLGFKGGSPVGKLKLLGFEIIKLPTILGSGIIKGIKNIFGL
jgi:hypothetical protein